MSHKPESDNIEMVFGVMGLPSDLSYGRMTKSEDLDSTSFLRRGIRKFQSEKKKYAVQ